MIISNVRYAFTRNLGNYESVKVEVEAAPSENQNPEALIEELRTYVEANLPGSTNTIEVTVKSKGETTVDAKPRNPRTKKADKLKVPVGIPEAVAVANTITNGRDLSVFYNACRDDASLCQLESFPDLSRAVAEKCQQICEIGSPERAAIGAALKSEKLRRENG